MSRQAATEFQRLLFFVAKFRELKNGCWEWKAAKIQNGYGRFSDGNKIVLAHRWAYEFFIGEIPKGLEIDHLCRKRDCVNPYHLEPVTHRENGLRGIAGDHRIKEAKTITHCIHGHKFDSRNTGTGYNPNNRIYRVCKTCKKEARKIYYAKNADKINLKKRIDRLLNKTKRRNK